MSTDYQLKEESPTWFFEDDTDKEMGIETCIYPNGGKTKRATLSDGKVATVRRLKGKDAKLIQRQSNGDPEKFQHAIISVCAKIDDKPVVIEELDEMWYDDFSKLQLMATINFSMTREA